MNDFTISAGSTVVFIVIGLLLTLEIIKFFILSKEAKKNRIRSADERLKLATIYALKIKALFILFGIEISFIVILLIVKYVFPNYEFLFSTYIREYFRIIIMILMAFAIKLFVDILLLYIFSIKNRTNHKQ